MGLESSRHTILRELWSFDLPGSSLVNTYSQGLSLSVLTQSLLSTNSLSCLSDKWRCDPRCTQNYLAKSGGINSSRYLRKSLFYPLLINKLTEQRLQVLPAKRIQSYRSSLGKSLKAKQNKKSVINTWPRNPEERRRIHFSELLNYIS